MRRRDFLKIAGAFSATAAAAQQSTPPVIGFLSTRGPADTLHLVAAFKEGLKTAGFIVGQNVALEFRWAEGRYDRLPGLANDLVRRNVSVIAATGGEPAALAAKAATQSVPIVFSLGTDPVKLGLVASYNRPGGNVTGINILTPTLETKRLGLLHELLPKAAKIAVLIDPTFVPSSTEASDVEAASKAAHLNIELLRAGSDEEIDRVFQTLTRLHYDALAVAAAPFFDTRREKLARMAAGLSIPAIYHFREYAVSGGLMSYGIDLVDAYRQVGRYTARILKGEKPSDLPVLQPTKFEMVINLKTARALDITVPATLLARADEVIE